ncbi:uncharacterized protein LDX57_001636 [Aspergillus melleus]|uniref:uncharacterized protein n=1 Tax=Aspergillus melleus TaxID=138277 RepID=UPI001E8DD343|nr:uncharacterized protein LDX57_001636 [Aspergillus melleus]KAH8423884.1 hypothetical protein LDX57_001636 [Aspergillus melleus]
MKVFTILGAAAALLVAPAVAQNNGAFHILPVESSTPIPSPTGPPSSTPWPPGVPRPTGSYPPSSSSIPWPTPTPPSGGPPHGSPNFPIKRVHARQLRA